MQDKVFIILNKPKGYVCALKDNLSPTVMDLINEDIKGLHIVGRLDKDTTGLLVLTNDGTYTHNATHPKKHVSKTYLVTLRDEVKEEYKTEIEKGMYIDHGETLLKPGKVNILDKNKLELTIVEGKFHQVKKMFFALGNEVIDLHRISFDKFSLNDLQIPLGKYIIK